MKINILEISKNKDFDLEIVLVNNLNQIECEKDREILENLELKVKMKQQFYWHKVKKYMLLLKSLHTIV